MFNCYIIPKDKISFHPPPWREVVFREFGASVVAKVFVCWLCLCRYNEDIRLNFRVVFKSGLISPPGADMQQRKSGVGVSVPALVCYSVKAISYFYNMSSKYKFADNDKLYFVSFAITNWIDLFIREVYKEEILKSIRYCQTNKGLELYGWCIMTSHVHLIIGTKGNPLQNIMRDLKRHTSEVLHNRIQNNQSESRRECLPDESFRRGYYG